MQKDHLNEEKDFSFKNWIIKQRFILTILFIYFFLHLLNLTLLPPYNDESIYIDWAWSYTHMPGHLYDSLLDAKQPLMMWIFAFFQNFFSDPLFAGRFVSVLFGAGTLIGIYFVAKRLFDKNIAFFSALLFSVIPIFVFYNRQALMEASIAALGIWTYYMLLRLIHEPTKKYAIWLGIILGIGFFIKSSSLLFITAVGGIIGYLILIKKRKEFLKLSGISVVSFFCITFLLFITPLFWQTFLSNDRYSLTIAELVKFPLALWWDHFSGFVEIGFLFITPVVCVCAVIGMIMMQKKRMKDSGIFLIFFLFALALEIFIGRYQNQRYLMPFLPFLVIPSVYLVMLIPKIVVRYIVMGILLLVPFSFSFFLIFNPDAAIMQMTKISRYANIEHVRGQMSGYGIKEAMQYIKENSVPSQPTLVLFALNAGNPESAVDVYSNKEPHLYALRIDARFFPGIEQFDCLTSNYPLFFITRYDQRVGMDRFFVLDKSFQNPDKKYSIGVYTLKKDCKGTRTSLSDFYEGSMNKILQIKSGNINAIPE